MQERICVILHDCPPCPIKSQLAALGHPPCRDALIHGGSANANQLRTNGVKNIYSAQRHYEAAQRYAIAELTEQVIQHLERLLLHLLMNRGAMVSFADILQPFFSLLQRQIQ